jgi:hypothetical protein
VTARPAGDPPEGSQNPGTRSTVAAPADTAPDRPAGPQLLDELATVVDPDLSDVITAGEAAQAQLLAELDPVAVQAEMRRVIEDLAARHPLTLTVPVDDQAATYEQPSAPDAGPAAVAAALATLRAYLDARPDDPDTPAALDALAQVAHTGPARRSG